MIDACLFGQLHSFGASLRHCGLKWRVFHGGSEILNAASIPTDSKQLADP
jgi:hypothetical protein